MPDLEKVIKGLECCKTEDCSYCPYMDTSAPIGKFGTDELIACRPVLYDDCIALLKEQGPLNDEGWEKSPCSQRQEWEYDTGWRKF